MFIYSLFVVLATHNISGFIPTPAKTTSNYSSLRNPEINDDPSEIEFIFKTVVDGLRLRAAPDPNSRIIAQLPENTCLLYLHEASAEPVEITLRNEKRSGRWYKVEVLSYEGPLEDKEGWVFSGALALIHIGPVSDNIFIKGFSNDILKVEKTTKSKFEAYRKKYDYKFLRDKPLQQTDTSFVLALGNGKRKKFSTDPCFFPDNRDSYTYEGQYPELKLYAVDKSCEHGEIDHRRTCFYDQYDGSLRFEAVGSFEVPLVCPQQIWGAYTFSGDCGSVNGITLTPNNKKDTWKRNLNIEISNVIPNRIAWTDRPGELAIECYIFNEGDDEYKAIQYHTFSLKTNTN